MMILSLETYNFVTSCDWSMDPKPIFINSPQSVQSKRAIGPAVDDTFRPFSMPRDHISLCYGAIKRSRYGIHSVDMLLRQSDKNQ